MEINSYNQEASFVLLSSNMVNELLEQIKQFNQMKEEILNTINNELIIPMQHDINNLFNSVKQLEEEIKKINQELFVGEVKLDDENNKIITLNEDAALESGVYSLRYEMGDGAQTEIFGTITV